MIATASFTLKQIKANILTKTGKLSRRDMELIEPQFNNLIYDSILVLRANAGSALDEWYTTKRDLGTLTLSSGYGTVSIAVPSISDIGKVRFYDATIGEIPKLSLDDFYAQKRLYSSSEFTTIDAIATILNVSAVADTAPWVLNVAIYTGATSPVTTIEMHYPRNPSKTTTETDTLDIPDLYATAIEDMVVKLIFQRLAQQITQGS